MAGEVYRDIVGLGGSAGGLEAVSQLLKALPSPFPAAILIVLHRSDQGSSVLPAVLRRAAPGKEIVEAQHDQQVEPGMVYVGPGNKHLLVRGDRIVLGFGPRENGVRPAADALFRSLAATRGPRAIG